MMIKLLSDEAILEAFDGDFGEISFDHKPTQEDIFLIKLKLVARKAEQEILRRVVDVLKNYGISITNEGILAPYNDEWDYLYDTPRRVLLRGNDKGESAIELWQELKKQAEEGK